MNDGLAHGYRDGFEGRDARPEVLHPRNRAAYAWAHADGMRRRQLLDRTSDDVHPHLVARMPESVRQLARSRRGTGSR